VTVPSTADATTRGAPAPDREARLLEAVAEKDDAALGVLYDDYGRAAYGLAFRILRDEALAEAAVEEAFLAVWRSAGSDGPERAKPAALILGLVHRRAVELMRRHNRRHDRAGTEELDRADERSVLHEALAQLPDTERQALELAYYGGYTQSELAERLGVPIGTVSRHIASGLARLRTVRRQE
jgi:RNA polymerase sigma-70 factor (ECF subfamily)